MSELEDAIAYLAAATLVTGCASLFARLPSVAIEAVVGGVMLVRVVTAVHEELARCALRTVLFGGIVQVCSTSVINQVAASWAGRTR